MDLNEVQQKDHLFFHTVSGSHAYGTALPGSDRDTRGIFVAPLSMLYGLEYVSQVSDERQDHVFYELGRAVELLLQSNPNLLELLAMPPDCLLYRHPLWLRLRPAYFLSKKCRDTFAGYALTQVKRARGLHKKILNPMDKERKSVLDFCYILRGAGALPLRKWLDLEKRRQEQCGLVSVPHFPEVYALFYDDTGNRGFSGILRKPDANQVALSSVPKDMEPLTYLSFNKNGYQTYCKDYRHYWEWVGKRNEARYENTLAHGKRYDAKNMMHTFRLLGMAEDIARHGELRVRRPDAEFLLAVRRGAFDYDELVRRAESRIADIETLFAKSSLPEEPDRESVEKILIGIRQEWYANRA